MKHAPSPTESIDPRLPTDRQLELAAMSNKQLDPIFLRGHTPDIDALLGYEFRGMNAPPWAKWLGIKKFIKGFYRDGDRAFGYNTPVVQNPAHDPWLHKPNVKSPKRFGFYRLDYVDPRARDNEYLHAALLDYGKGDNPIYDPSRGLRDYLVQVDEDDPDHFLGKAFYAVGKRRIFTNFFVLGRLGKADPAQTGRH